MSQHPHNKPLIDLVQPAGWWRTDQDWRHWAACQDMDTNLWYREGITGELDTLDAKAVCRRCPVRIQCLDYALEGKERFGVWGGLSPQERRTLERRRAGKQLRKAN